MNFSCDQMTLDCFLDCLNVINKSFSQTSSSSTPASTSSVVDESDRNDRKKNHPFDDKGAPVLCADDGEDTAGDATESATVSPLKASGNTQVAPMIVRTKFLYAKYGDFNSSVLSRPITEPNNSLCLLMSKSPASVVDNRLKQFWTILAPVFGGRNASFEDFYELRDRGDATFREHNNLEMLQSRMVVTFHNYYFAAECWHFIVSPRIYGMRLPSSISSKSKVQYKLMKCPVVKNNKLFVDSGMVVVNMSVELLSMHLCGIRTAIADKVYSGDNVINFDLRSGHSYAVFVCIDTRYFNGQRKLPPWMKKK